MEAPCPIYVYRDPHFAPAADTVVAAARLGVVVAVYGGGVFGEGGLAAAFGGAIVFKDNASDCRFLGVWGKRNAARFRAALSAHCPIQVIDEAPPAPLQLFNKTGVRPKRSPH
jgi:hypothetical protein